MEYLQLCLLVAQPKILTISPIPAKVCQPLYYSHPALEMKIETLVMIFSYLREVLLHSSLQDGW